MTTSDISNQAAQEPEFLPAEDAEIESKGPEYIVGIGASAGGLDALERFFSNLPPDTEAAYVVIQHLSPDFKSMMAEILGRKTTMPIFSAEDGMAVKPNHIYLNTPRHDLRIQDGILHLTEVRLGEQMPPHPINVFFTSLAKDKGPKAISIVLSGTGTDGSLGSAAISAAGGLVITQDIASAQFPSMPRSAAAQAPSDLVLDPSDIPASIIDFIDSDIRISQGDLSLLDFSMMTGENAFSYLLSMLRREYGIDYTLYKPQTLVRRVERRISLNHHDDLMTYIHVLQEDQEEMDALYRDVMVDVTSFFRDPEAFKILETELIPQIIQKKQDGDSARFWVAGCASGEEAYSLAMLFLEEIERQGKQVSLKVFATDAHKNSITRAGSGVFSSERLQAVPVDLQSKYFVQHGANQFQIRPEVRRSIVFAPHNLLVDAHFTNLDLISCRNVMIYLRQEVQSRVLSSFHQGLKLNGILFLGASEHLGEYEQDYVSISRHWRIYRKSRMGVKLPNKPTFSPRIKLPDNLEIKHRPIGAQTWERGLLHSLIESGYVVDDHGHLLQIYGQGERYVEFKSGRVDLILSNVVVEDLSTPIRTGLFRAQQEKETVLFEQITVEQDSELSRLNLSIIPFDSEPIFGDGMSYYLVKLESIQLVEKESSESEDEGQHKFEDLDRIRGLERELAFTRESLQATIEEVETTNEELQSSNEELIAANEELQSTNEELSSVNEELFTVNSEYQDQNDEIKQSNQDMDNLIRSSGIMAIFLDEDLRLRIITPATYDVFGLMEGDIGRPITHFSSFVEIGTELLLNLSKAALKGEEKQTKISMKNGPNLIMKTLPYIGSNTAVEGVVFYFIPAADLRK